MRWLLGLSRVKTNCSGREVGRFGRCSIEFIRAPTTLFVSIDLVRVQKSVQYTYSVIACTIIHSHDLYLFLSMYINNVAEAFYVLYGVENEVS
jgi:hypothetical protein